MNINCKNRNKSCYKKYTLCHRKKIIYLSHRKNISCDKIKWIIIPVTENILHAMHTVLLVIGGTFPVTWNTPMWQKKIPATGRMPPVKRSIICVTERLFPMRERILPVKIYGILRLAFKGGYVLHKNFNSSNPDVAKLEF